uniref:RnfABCDGE type electron transport complex subunit G n=1 Tax=Acetatifactor sp. TaxID=1872090 RepID=UPI004055CF33
MKNNKDIKIMLKEAGILFAITLISGLVLGFVYELTKEPIRLQQEKAIQEACAAVFPDSGDLGMTFEEQKYVPSAKLQEELAATGVEIGTVYSAVSQGGMFCGYVVESTSKEGYGGNIVLYVGVQTDGTVSGVSILEIAETPGLGMKAEDELVPQYAQVQTDAFTYTKSGSTMDSEIDAISGATVTTKAVTNAVNGGLKVANELLQGGGSNE